MSGINTYTGPTTVNAGALIVNGSIETSSPLTVNVGATVGGDGNLPTTIVNGGTLSPCNSVGQLNVIGNLQFNAGSLYQVEVFGASADKTRVTGAATLLGGTVQVAILGPMQFGTPYTIVSTGSGVTGQFAGLSGGTNYVDMALSYPGQDVLLTLTPAFGSFDGLNVNQRSTATGLDHGLLQAGTSAGFDALFQLPPALLPNALTQLSGELGTAAAPAGLESMNRFLMLMLDPFAGTRGDDGTVGPALGFAPAPPSRDAAKAYAAFLPITKAPALAFEERWTGWGAAYGSTAAPMAMA